MRSFSKSFAILLFAAFAMSGCKDVGFREIDVSAKSRASVQTARDVMAQIQQGLHNFYDLKHRYPETTEAYLYDSIRNYIPNQIDPIDLYRNDNGKGYFIAVGARSEKIVYRYPPTIGIGDYTLYWVGPNGVDEEGEGDDVDAWQPEDTAHHFERQRHFDLQNDGIPDQMHLIRTGPDINRDSVIFEITRHDTLRYREEWPLAEYFKDRPELNSDERKRLIRAELDRFFSSSAFVHTDSLMYRQWPHWGEVQPQSPEMTALIRSGETMFDFYEGALGSKGIVWLPSANKFVVVWGAK
jgi:hypothetical protein